MEIEKENKLKKNLKVLAVVGVVFALCLTVTLSVVLNLGGKQKPEEVSTSAMTFTLPMQNAVVVKDYADNRLQFNETLNRWEIHLAVDLASENNSVFAISDGVVKSVSSNSLEGSVIEIQHQNGFVSVYSSLSSDVKVKEGDSVTKGQNIGSASNTAGNESSTENHLHLVMLLNGEEVDPNNYLDLQNK